MKRFTLVEILIVVALIGLLVAIAVPSFVMARDNARKGMAKKHRTETNTVVLPPNRKIFSVSSTTWCGDMQTIVVTKIKDSNSYEIYTVSNRNYTIINSLVIQEDVSVPVEKE